MQKNTLNVTASIDSTFFDDSYSVDPVSVSSQASSCSGSGSFSSQYTFKAVHPSQAPESPLPSSHPPTPDCTFHTSIHDPFLDTMSSCDLSTPRDLTRTPYRGAVPRRKLSCQSPDVMFDSTYRIAVGSPLLLKLKRLSTSKTSNQSLMNRAFTTTNSSVDNYSSKSEFERSKRWWNSNFY